MFSFWICMTYLPLNVKPHATNQSRVTKETHLCIHYFVYTLAIDTVHRLNVLLCTSIILFNILRHCPLWHYEARPVNFTSVKYSYLTFQWNVECWLADKRLLEINKWENIIWLAYSKEITYFFLYQPRRLYPPLRLQFHNERSCINININRLFSLSFITEARNSRRLHKFKIAEKTCTLW